MGFFDAYNQLKSEIQSRVTSYMARREVRQSRFVPSTVVDASRSVYDRVSQRYRDVTRPRVKHSSLVETQKSTLFHRHRTVTPLRKDDEKPLLFRMGSSVLQAGYEGEYGSVRERDPLMTRAAKISLNWGAAVNKRIDDESQRRLGRNLIGGGVSGASNIVVGIPFSLGSAVLSGGAIVTDSKIQRKIAEYPEMAGYAVAKGMTSIVTHPVKQITSRDMYEKGQGFGTAAVLIAPFVKSGKPPTATGVKGKPFLSKMKTPEGLIPGKKIKFESGAEVATVLKKVKPSIKEPLDFTQIKSLPGDKGVKIESWIRSHPEQQPVVGGSTAAKTQFRLARKPGDIDLNVQNVKASGTDIYNTMFKDMGPEKARSRYELKHDRYLIQTKTEGKWHDAVDIHPTVPKGSSLRFGFKTQNPIEIGGIKYKPAGELIQRKAESVLLPQKGGTIGPKSFRMKDVGDFEKFASDALKSQREQAQNALFFKGRRLKKVAHLERKLDEYKFHSYYGPDIEMAYGAAKGYTHLPFSVKGPISFLGLTSIRSSYDSMPRYESPITPGYVPRGYEPLVTPDHVPLGYVPRGYEPLITPDHVPLGYVPRGYEPLITPDHVPLGYVPRGYEPPDYEPSCYPGYESPGYPGYEPPRSPGYKSPGYPGYEPPGYSGYELPGYPGYKLPVYPQPRKPKSPFDFDLKEEFIPRKKKKSSSKESETYPWFPAGLGYVTMEESMTGLPALHIADPGKTRMLFSRYKLTGKSIPTLKQITK